MKPPTKHAKHFTIAKNRIGHATLLHELSVGETVSLFSRFPRVIDELHGVWALHLNVIAEVAVGVGSRTFCCFDSPADHWPSFSGVPIFETCDDFPNVLLQGRILIQDIAELRKSTDQLRQDELLRRIAQLCSEMLNL